MNIAHIIISLIGVLIITSLVTVGMIIYWHEEGSACTTPKCLHEASRILKDMNPEIEPCDNFYEFVCGGYLTSTRIPDGADGIDRFSEQEERIKSQLRSSLEEPISPDEPRLFRLGKILYRDCMNEPDIKEVDAVPLREVLEKYGKWPVVEGETWREADFDLKKYVNASRDLGIPVHWFIPSTVISSRQIDIRKPATKRDISQHSLAQGMENDDVKAHFKRMVDVAKFLGAAEERATRELEEALNYKIEEARERENAEFRGTIAELGKKYPSVDWKEYMNNLSQPDVRVDAEDIFIVLPSDSLQRLNQLQSNTPHRVRQNAFLLRVVDEVFKISTRNATQRQVESASTTSENIVTDRDCDRWRKCVEKISKSTLSIITNALYVRKYFDDVAREKVDGMVADIKQGMIEVLNKADDDQLDNKTRSVAVDKVESIRSQVVYPVVLVDDRSLEELYDSPDFELALDDFFEISLHRSESSRNHSLWFTREPMINGNWPPADLSYSTKVDADYSEHENSIRISPGMLHGPFFDGDRPQYMNYGAVGFLIGREISLGFDPVTINFDKYRNLVNPWTSERIDKCHEKIQCIVDQYSNYTLESVGRKVNGQRTKFENVADNSGVRTAYLAYKEFMKRNGPEAKLPGLEYTPEQMFWISAANTWCGKFSPQKERLQIDSSNESPHRFRVIGSFANSPEFSTDFNCPMGSYMNPVKKCPVFQASNVSLST